MWVEHNQEVCVEVWNLLTGKTCYFDTIQNALRHYSLGEN